jgi:hypothetical protein
VHDRATWRPLAGSPGFYTDEAGALHVDEDEAIRGAGYEPNDQTRRMLRKVTADLAAQIGAQYEEPDW